MASFGNSKYWKVRLPNNIGLPKYLSYLRYKGSKEIMIKTNVKNRQILVKFKNRKNIRTKNFLKVYNPNVHFKRLSYEQWNHLHKEKPKKLSECIREILLKEKMTKEDFLNNTSLIHHKEKIEKAIEGFQTPIPTPEKLSFGSIEINLNQKQKHIYIWGPPNTGKTTFWKKKCTRKLLNRSPK